MGVCAEDEEGDEEDDKDGGKLLDELAGCEDSKESLQAHEVLNENNSDHPATSARSPVSSTGRIPC